MTTIDELLSPVLLAIAVLLWTGFYIFLLLTYKNAVSIRGDEKYAWIFGSVVGVLLWEMSKATFIFLAPHF